MKKFILFAFFSLIATTVMAQSAEDYFHNGGQSFIHADIDKAISEVQNGLAQYPNNPKLNALMEKLQEEKEKQQQRQEQNQQQNQDQQNQQQEQQQDQEQQNQEEQDQQQQQQDKGQNQDGQNPEEMDAEQLQSQKISKEDAEKILQALAQKEKELLKEFKKKKSDGSAKHDKDW